MASSIGGTVTDQNGVPVAGARVYVYDAEGGLADLSDAMDQPAPNPVVTDDLGFWQAFAPSPGLYRFDYWWGGRKRLVEANNALGDWFKGDPGGNVESIGLFTTAALGALDIASGTTTVRTSGYRAIGVGAARYVHDSGAVAAYVVSNPLSSFLDASGRVFKFDTEQVANPMQFGGYGNAVVASNIWTGTDDTAACVAAIASGSKVIEISKPHMVNKTTSGAILTITGLTVRFVGAGRLCKAQNQSGSQSGAVFLMIAENGAKIINPKLEGSKSGIGLGTNQRTTSVWIRGDDVYFGGPGSRVANFTGYGPWMNGQVSLARRCIVEFVYVENCDVGLEPTYTEDCEYRHCVVRDGDADVQVARIACEIYGTAKRLRILNVDIEGTFAPFNIGLDFGAMEDVEITGRAKTTGTTSAMTVSRSTGTETLTRLNLSGLLLDASGSTDGLGASLNHVRDAYFSDSFFFGDGIGIALGADCDGVQASNCYAKGDTLQAGDVTSGASNVTWDGRLVGATTAYTGEMMISPTTLTSPAGGVVPYRILAVGQGAMITAGGTESRLAITTPTILDPTKVAVHVTMREADTLFAPALTGRTFTWSYINTQSLNILEKAGTLAGQIVSYTAWEGR